MLEADGTSPHTAHTSNPVPLVVTAPDLRIAPGGELADLAPTALAFLGLAQPLQMSGKNLISSDLSGLYSAGLGPHPA